MTTSTHRVLAALLALLTLAGCAGLPTSDRVERGLPVLGQPQQGGQVLPDGPEPDAGPEAILGGFLLANVGFTDDHETGRSFLTDELASGWVPTSRVLVYDGDVEVELEDEGSVVATVQVIGTLDESGYLTEHPAGTTRTDRFGMTRVEGQWRISDFPEDFGLWLTGAGFAGQYRTATINYLAQQSAEFVPDVRWFPRYPQGSGLPTALARAQLQPPPDFLAGAVRHAVPDGVELTANGVPVEPSTGTATVDLTGSGVSGSPEQTRQMWAQLTRTLTQAPGVSRVRLQSGGRTLEIPGVESTLADPAEIGYTAAGWTVPFGLLRVRDELTAIDPESYNLRDHQPERGEQLPILPQVPVRWADLATDAAVRDFAAVSTDRQVLWRWSNGQEATLQGVGTSLTAPGYDGRGGLWVAGDSATGPRVWVVDTTQPLSRAVAGPVAADWLQEGTRVLHFQVGPAGARAVIHLLDTQTGAQRLALTGVVRDSQGTPQSLTEPRLIAPTLETVTSIGWSSPTSLVAVGRRAGDELDTPYLVPLGDWVAPLTRVDEPRLLQAVPTEEEFALILLTGPGRLYTQEGPGWSTVRNGDDVIIPGN